MELENELSQTYALNILLADDDKDDCIFFKEALEEMSLLSQLTCVYNGDQLMLFLNKKLQQLPDVLFLDLNMPRKNGFACLKEIKSDNKLKHLPVIILSTSYEGSIANLLYKNGAHYYICKPADFNQLKDVINLALTLIKKNSLSQPSLEEFFLNKEKLSLK